MVETAGLRLYGDQFNRICDSIGLPESPVQKVGLDGIAIPGDAWRSQNQIEAALDA